MVQDLGTPPASWHPAYDHPIQIPFFHHLNYLHVHVPFDVALSEGGCLTCPVLHFFTVKLYSYNTAT